MIQGGATVKEAAAATGIKEMTIYKWASRYNWNLLSVKSVIRVKKRPAQALQEILSKRGQRSKLAMSRVVANGVKAAAKAKLPVSQWQDVRHLEAVRASVHGEPQLVESRNMNLNANVGLSREALELILAEAKLM